MKSAINIVRVPGTVNDFDNSTACGLGSNVPERAGGKPDQGEPAMHALNVLKAMIAGFGLALFATSEVAALDGKALAEENCAACHDLKGPAPATFGELRKRKAPDLFYAGSKFKRSWLVGWLQNPTRIRGAGVMYLDHIAVENGKDTVREDSIIPCPVKFDPQEAEAVAGYLMTLKDPAMKTGVIDPAKKFSKSKARRLFTKQLPCIGCHTARFGKRILGGVSGPVLSEAGKRLNPDWVYSRIENPQYWDPKTWMPRVEMSHKKREMLTLLIVSMQ